MEKQFKILAACVSVMFFCASCTVSYINADTLRLNYEKKIQTRHQKKSNSNQVKVFMNENEVTRDFVVTAYGSYTPLILPIIRPERPRLEKNLLWKAARKARKLNGDGVIIDNKNDFRVIKYK
jgi:CO dehydrogenase/acetyl-CoA synthase beta subunit